MQPKKGMQIKCYPMMTSTLLCGEVPTHRFTVQYLSPIHQNVQDLNVEQLELFPQMFECETSKPFTKIYKCLLFTEVCHFFSQEINTYSSITLPNFLTGAIIETWFQALLPAPPLPLPKTNSTHMAVGWNKPTPQCWTDCTQSMNITAATHPQYCSPSQQFFQT